jgi:hypothetical protein
MNATVFQQQPTKSGPSEWYSELVRRQPTLTRAGIGAAALALPSALVGLIDHRQVLGINTWIKPTKFFLSMAIYILTIAWAFAFLSPERRNRRAARYVVVVTIAAAVLEQTIITVRAALGQRSHFNIGTPLDAAWYNVMAVGAVLLVSTAVVMSVMVWRSKVLTGSRRFAWSAGLFLAGTLGGFTGGVLGGGKNHFVGDATSDTMGIPLLGWSRSVGDLRIAHFTALHSMFVLPFIGWLVHRRWGDTKRASTITLVACFVWIAVVLGTFANALAGRPLL